MADGTLGLLDTRRRHRSPGVLTRLASAVKHLNSLPASLRFFAEPFEIWTAGACLLTGVPATLGKARPGALALATQTVPWLLNAWGVLLCLGGVATLIARWRIGRPQTDLGDVSARALEVLGLVILATAIGIYAIAILVLGMIGLAAGTTTAAMSASCAMRAWIVSAELKRQRA